MLRPVLTALLCCFACSLSAQITVSDNHRYLLRNGRPFFWLGDTAWELFHRLNREQASQYLQHRAEQGFTVIQAVVLAEFDGLHTPNAYGEVPLLQDDPTRPNEAYFAHVDYIIRKADSLGLVIGLLPTWGDKVWKASWGRGPEIFNPQNAETYGKWLGQRYGSRKNIVWILGGDRNPQNETHIAIWRRMAAGILAGTAQAHPPLITFHPQPTPLGSATWFHQDQWLGFNMFQNGHCRHTPVYERIQAVYSMSPVKPMLDGEPLYEDHPVCFNAKDLGTSSAYDVRQYAYLDLFAGAFGHTYGCHDIWQFYSPDHEGKNGPHVYWQQAMDLPGARQMQYVRRLMEANPLTERVPDQSLIVENDLLPAERVQATRGRDYAYIYTCVGRPFTVNMSKISGRMLSTGWYNPRTGHYQPADTVENIGQRTFTPPAAGYGQDWVLVLQDTARRVAL
ncbi:glycoside hydrolase family 140 protein [Chitinophaga japonensis]|uniref:Collagenase-like protein with putative collagen-binding domain n=1 Tax=Chitinophaga japonensis TaxID=104662 RepID=A0A562T3Z4_CHIJA|nr:glycoside hydrolase family 140 protein [Chitinophaga japonensis]TWI88265.1 collagenase-like protein with putative collagen-binding domain [Chitinophaga japonensis]